MIDRREELLSILVKVTTYESALDELNRSIRVLAAARWELLRYMPRRISQLAAFMPSNNLLYSYVLTSCLPALYCDRIFIRPSGRVRDVYLALHEVLEECMEVRASGRVYFTNASQRQFIGVCQQSDAVVFSGTHTNALNVLSEIGPRPMTLLFGSGPNPIVLDPSLRPKLP